jgi:hypothetical protein
MPVRVRSHHKRHARNHQESDVPHDLLKPNPCPHNAETNSALPGCREKDSADYRSNQRQIDGALDANRVTRSRLWKRIAAVANEVYHQECTQEQSGNKRGLHPDIPGGPKEIDPTQKAGEQWRVTKRCQGSADVAH